MNYLEQLKNFLWLEKRNIIVKKHNYKCQSCLNKKIIEELEPCLIFLPDYKKNIFGGINLISKEKILISGPNSILDKMNFKRVVYVKKSKKTIHFTDIDGFAVCVREFTPNEEKYFTEINFENFEVVANSQRKINQEEILEVFKSYEKMFLTLEKKTDFNVFSFHENELLFEKAQAINEGLNKKLLDDPLFKHNEEIRDFKWLYSYGLNVHHKFYQNGKMAWEYEDYAFETYCQPCHLQHHLGENVDHFDLNGNKIGELTCCKRCASQGVIPIYQNLYEGICFHCCGARYEELIKPEYNKIIFEKFKIPYSYISYL